MTAQWCHGVVVTPTAQLYSIKPELKFCAGSNPAHGVSEICDSEDLWQWSPLEIRTKIYHKNTKTIPNTTNTTETIHSSSPLPCDNIFIIFIFIILIVVSFKF